MVLTIEQVLMLSWAGVLLVVAAREYFRNDDNSNENEEKPPVPIAITAAAVLIPTNGKEEQEMTDSNESNSRGTPLAARIYLTILLLGFVFALGYALWNYGEEIWGSDYYQETRTWTIGEDWSVGPTEEAPPPQQEGAHSEAIQTRPSD